MIPGSAFGSKQIGGKQIKFTGSGAHAMPTGYQCWGIEIRIDGTKITAITQNLLGTPTVYTSGNVFIDS